MLTKTTIREAIKTRRLAILTAWRANKPADVNGRNMARLQRMLDQIGTKWYPVEGVYKGGSEPSILIIDDFDPQLILDFGDLFGQESVVINSRLISTHNWDGTHPTILRFDLDKTVFGPKARKMENHTRYGKSAFALVAA